MYRAKRRARNASGLPLVSCQEVHATRGRSLLGTEEEKKETFFVVFLSCVCKQTLTRAPKAETGFFVCGKSLDPSYQSRDQVLQIVSAAQFLPLFNVFVFFH
uniref:(northern house mosquito) hypothetical protein n=1 Tax=Culex pipiens TaxID=7175 RepID=A0A8D8CKA3_CULPI